ncbi:MAG: MFS transporter [Dehalococcoidales bacterium]|nr:MFS transporter [Dehalococcoidales bacterium]
MFRRLHALITNALVTVPRLGRNVIILSVCQAIGFSGAPLALLLGGIVGSQMAPSPVWATLPIAASVIGVAITTIPAALLMKRIGRKRGFILAAIGASVAALGAALAIIVHSFFLFCLALLLMGGNSAFILQYRFAAAESVESSYTGRAVSFVLIGGILAGFLGPEIGRSAKDWITSGVYSGSFVAMAILYAISTLCLLFLKNIVPKENVVMSTERPLRVVMAQRSYLVAVLSSTVAFGVMGFIMSATPLSMHVMDHFSLEDTALVIQGHIIAMYLPSLFTGFLLERLGLKLLQVLGVVIMFTGVTIAVSGHNFFNYLVALISIGIGWNFLFVAGTVMLTRSYYPSERFKAQGANDFVVSTLQALAILLTGTVLYKANWELVNLLSLPFLVLALIMVLTIRLQVLKP